MTSVSGPNGSRYCPRLTSPNMSTSLLSELFDEDEDEFTLSDYADVNDFIDSSDKDDSYWTILVS